MKTYNVSGVVSKATGFGWLGFLVSGAKYTGTMTLQGTKKAFDTIAGTLKYEFALSSVKSWGFDITSLVVSNLGGKKSTTGQIVVNGTPFTGTVLTTDGYNIFYKAEVKDAWNNLVGDVDVTNKATASTDATAALVKDDAIYDEEPVVPPEPDPDPVPGPLGELVDPPLTSVEVDANRDFEDCGIEGEFKVIFRGHTKRPSVNGYWNLSSPFVVVAADGKRTTTVYRDGNDVVCPDRTYRGVVFHCIGWMNIEPKPNDMNPKLDYVGNRAPWGVKHAVIECHKPAAPQPPVTKDEFAKSKMHTAKQEVADWPVVSTLNVTYYDKKRIRIDVDDATRAKWPKNASINIHCVLYRNGEWHAGPCDWVKAMPSVKDFKCLCVPDGDKRTYVPDPKLDTKVKIVLTTKCRNGMTDDKFRSTVCEIDLPK